MRAIRCDLVKIEYSYIKLRLKSNTKIKLLKAAITSFVLLKAK